MVGFLVRTSCRKLAGVGVFGSGVKLFGRRCEGGGRGRDEMGTSLLGEDMVWRKRRKEGFIDRPGPSCSITSQLESKSSFSLFRSVSAENGMHCEMALIIKYRILLPKLG
jgi:hypothetical protein